MRLKRVRHESESEGLSLSHQNTFLNINYFAAIYTMCRFCLFKIFVYFLFPLFDCPKLPSSFSPLLVQLESAVNWNYSSLTS